MEDIKTEVFETEDVKIENEIIEEEELETEKRLTFGIVVDDGILDFHEENVIPEKVITEGGNNVKESCETHSFHEQNYKIIEEIKSNSARYLLRVINKEKTLTWVQTCGVKVHPSEVRNTDISIYRKNNESSLYCKSEMEKHESLIGNPYEYAISRKNDLKSIHFIQGKEQPFNCTRCGSSFTRESSLARHTIAVHLNEKMYKCSECKYSSSLNSCLLRHVRSVHLKEKTFRCANCEYSCAEKCTLATHVRSIHLKEKPFRCSECRYSCIQKSDLSVHILAVHLKGRPFTCTQCEYTCSKKGNLAAHVKTIHLKEKRNR